MSSINTNYSSLFTTTNDNYNVSSLFASSGSSNTSSTSFLTDYASIKNGSYGKLLKAYYASKETSESGGDSSSKYKVDSDEKIAAMKSAINSLAESAGSITEAMFEKKNITTKDEQGNETEKLDYDIDSIYKSVSSFVESYNRTLDAVSESDDQRILRQTLSMQNVTDKNSSLLSKVGITINEKNELVIDEDKFKAADMTTVKSLFTGSNSYGDSIANKTRFLYSSVKRQTGSETMYSSNGSYLDKVLSGNNWSGTV